MNTRDVRDVVAYVRAVAGAAIEPQLSAIERHALDSGMRVSKVFVDSKDEDRTGLEEALDWLQSGMATALLVWRLDQIDSKFTDMESFLTFVNDLTANRITFVSVLDQLDSSGGAAVFAANLIPAIRRFKARLKGERVHRSLGVAKLEGRHVGRPRRRDDGRILALRKEGRSIRQIAATLGLSSSSVQSALRTKEVGN